MAEAYNRLHRQGHAHSVEVWRDGKLVGGIYGLALGAAFFGESMFSRETDASKIALVALCRQLEKWRFSLLDCQVPNPHLLTMGAVKISRRGFENHLHAAVSRPGKAGFWRDRFTVGARW